MLIERRSLDTSILYVSWFVSDLSLKVLVQSGLMTVKPYGEEIVLDAKALWNQKDVGEPLHPLVKKKIRTRRWFTLYPKTVQIQGEFHWSIHFYWHYWIWDRLNILTIECWSKCNSFGAYSSAGTIDLWIYLHNVPLMSQFCPSHHRQICLHLAQEHHEWTI